jgi:methionyl-tRNA synthetase
MYVWFDALVNYITAAGFPGDCSRLWPADLHVIGKDITRFHAVIWPAMLMSAGLPLPRKLAIHGFVYVRKGDQRFKMSKTLGTVIDPVMVANRFGADALRNFLMAEVAFGQDGDFSWDAFFNRSNSDLADKLGNLLNRVVAMTERYQAGVLASKGAPLPQDAALRDSVGGLADRIAPMMDRFEFHAALAEIWKAVAAANGHIEASAPWTLAKQGKKDEVAGVLYRSAEALRIMAILLTPFIPSTARRILEQLGIPGTDLNLAAARSWEAIPEGTRVQKGSVLFQKVDPHAEQP